MPEEKALALSGLLKKNNVRLSGNDEVAFEEKIEPDVVVTTNKYYPSTFDNAIKKLKIKTIPVKKRPKPEVFTYAVKLSRDTVLVRTSSLVHILKSTLEEAYSKVGEPILLGDESVFTTTMNFFNLLNEESFEKDIMMIGSSEPLKKKIIKELVDKLGK